MRWQRAVVLLLAVACSFERAPLGGDGGGPGPMIDTGPFDPDAAGPRPDADPLAPDASSCEPGCTASGDYRSCPGGSEQIEDCGDGPLACTETPTPHCPTIVPSNEPDWEMHLAMVPTSADLVVEAGAFATDHWEIFTDNGEIYDAINGAEIRAAGTGVDAETGIGFFPREDGVGVFVVDSLTIEDGAKLWVYGARALLILSRGDVVLNGQIDVTAGVCPDGGAVDARCPGPGGSYGSNGETTTGFGCGGGGNGEDDGGNETGGGGGGFGTVGAQGANGPNVDDPGGTGGVVTTCPTPDLVPLQGGSGGGWGGGATGDGGGGGGAVQITSFTSILVQQATIGTPVGIWAGGAGGKASGASGAGGGGGGSGGGILLEAPTVTIGLGVWLAANGGGGGSGHTTNTTGDGQLGGFGATPAAGGTSGRGGGAGAAGIIAATPGTGGGDGTGGGGGGAGIIRLNGDVSGAGASNCSPLPSIGPLPVE